MAKDNPKRHPEAHAWQSWRDGDEGQGSLAGSAAGEYLENRLWAAYIAGWKAASERVNQALEEPYAKEPSP
jgi:hypothetical protein